jgi:hypothetical protein
MRSLQRNAALIAVGLVLWTLYSSSNVEYSWAVWSILALTLVLEFLAYQLGVAKGIEIYIAMTSEQRKEIEQLLNEANK